MLPKTPDKASWTDKERENQTSARGSAVAMIDALESLWRLKERAKMTLSICRRCRGQMILLQARVIYFVLALIGRNYLVSITFLD